MWKCKERWNIQLTLGIWCGPLSQHPLPPARHQPHLLIPSAQSNSHKKQRTQKWDSTFSKSYRTAFKLSWKQNSLIKMLWNKFSDSTSKSIGTWKFSGFAAPIIIKPKLTSYFWSWPIQFYCNFISKQLKNHIQSPSKCDYTMKKMGDFCVNHVWKWPMYYH